MSGHMPRTGREQRPNYMERVRAKYEEVQRMRNAPATVTEDCEGIDPEPEVRFVPEEGVQGEELGPVEPPPTRTRKRK